MENMKKTWKFLKFNHYQFESSDLNTVVVKFNRLSRFIEVQSSNDRGLFKLQIEGMFRSKLIMTDYKGKELVKLESKKWWKSNWFGVYQKKSIELKIMNNPWVEYVLFIDGVKALSYGLKPYSGKAILSVQQFIPLLNAEDYFHIILFSLIRPVLIESMGNEVNMGA